MGELLSERHRFGHVSDTDARTVIGQLASRGLLAVEAR
jgi:hypothetical protein